jgi:hypothetical protein
MAFLKFADACISNRAISLGDWSEIRARSRLGSTEIVSKSDVMSRFDPSEFLFTHASIVASVDVEDNDYFITPGTTKFVNSNYDAFERRLLRSCWSSFHGAENYLEHVQIPTLSKGKVVDAVIRDLGDTDYVDILVATAKKHKDLVSKIEQGSLNTLSMGAVVAFTICSRCGNKATDEVSLCGHIKYGKGDEFIDENGVRRKVAELCGHRDDPNSVVFIEASWVKSPAFAGAVVRNIVPALSADQIATVKGNISKSIVVPEGLRKAASTGALQELQQAVDLVKQADKMLTDLNGRPGLVYKMLRRKNPLLDTEVMPETEGKRELEDREPVLNDTLIQAAVDKLPLSEENKIRILGTLKTAVTEGWEGLAGKISQRVFLGSAVLLAQILGQKDFSPRLAKVLEEVGPSSLYKTEESFISRCELVVGRRLAKAEQDALCRYGQLMEKFLDGKARLV